MRCGVIGWPENETTQIGTQNPAVSSRLGPANGTADAWDPHFSVGGALYSGLRVGRSPHHPASAAATKAAAPIPSSLFSVDRLAWLSPFSTGHNNEH